MMPCGYDTFVAEACKLIAALLSAVGSASRCRSAGAHGIGTDGSDWRDQ
jgi:hypothetical protein